MKRIIILMGVAIGLMGMTGEASAAMLAGYALQFDGSDDYVRVAPSDQLAFTGAITLEAWTNIGELKPDASFITRGDNAHDHGEYSLKLSPIHQPQPGQRLDLDFNDKVWDQGDEMYGIASLPTNQWVHVAATFDGATARLFINGELDNEQAMTVRDNLYTYDTYFGFDPPGWDEYFKGIIDEIRIWNIARTPEEIAYWYNRIVESNTSGLVGYWNFNEGSGQTAHDLTGNANHGRLGSTWNPDVNDPIWVLSGAPIVPEPGTVLLVAIGMLVLLLRFVRRRR